MQATNDIHQPTEAGDSGLDAREAARLLQQSTRDARREFGLRPPLAIVSGGMVILLAYGALWLSVRGQHPYSGPSLGVVGLVYAVVAISIGVSARIYQRATAGISGPAIRQQRVEGVAILLFYIASPVIQGAMKHYGASHAIVYGVVPAAVPLIVIGTTLLGVAGTKADWPQFGAAVVVVSAGIVAIYVGPIGAWLVAGIGLSVAVAGYAVATAWLRRHRVVGA